MRLLDIESGVNELICGTYGAAIYSNGILKVPSLQKDYMIQMASEEYIRTFEIEGTDTSVYINNYYSHTTRLVCLDVDDEYILNGTVVSKNGDYVFIEFPAEGNMLIQNIKTTESFELVDANKLYSQGDITVLISFANPFVFRIWSLSKGCLIDEVSLEHVELIRSTKSNRQSWEYIISHVIGIYGNLIYLKLGGKFILVYNLESRKFVATLGFGEDEAKWNSENIEYLFIAPHLDVTSGALFSLIGYWYTEVEISESGLTNILTINLKEDLLRLDLGQINGNLKLPRNNGLLYFLTVGSSQHRNNLGVFDRNKSKVVESADYFNPRNLAQSNVFKYNHPPLRNICLNDGILYIHFNDRAKTLLRVYI
jgi:hypothetical protein